MNDISVACHVLVKTRNLGSQKKYFMEDVEE